MVLIRLSFGSAAGPRSPASKTATTVARRHGCDCAVCQRKFGFDEALPDELWAKIFALVDFPTAMSFVCSRFNRIYRSYFHYSCRKLRWATPFTKELKGSGTKKTLAQRLETLSTVIEGLSRLFRDYNRFDLNNFLLLKLTLSLNRTSQSIFTEAKAATNAFWLFASHGNLPLLR